MIWGAIVVAAGRGERFGGPKQLVEVAGRPLVAWSLAAFGAMPEILELAIATEPQHVARMMELAAEFAPRLAVRVVPGGATRQDSVRAALGALPERCSATFVHDGARPLILPRDVRAGMRAVRAGVASLLAAPVVDTIKVVGAEDRKVLRTLDREQLWAAQTPQFALTRELRRAHGDALRYERHATDDATLLERAGLDVIVVPASDENFKVTHPADRERAEAILRARPLLGPTEDETLLVEAFVEARAVESVSRELESRGRLDGIDRELPRGAAIRAFVDAERLRGFAERFAELAGVEAIFTTHQAHDVAGAPGT
jgi:2-C-methyl-D-erythritol 4-phosphate cytidylyltransferase